MLASNFKRKLVRSIIVFVAIWNNLFLILKRQCLERQRSVRSKGSQKVANLIDTFKPYQENVFRWQFALHSFGLVRYLIQILLAFEISQGFRELDCFLIHRMVPVGRVYDFMKYFCIIFSAMFLYHNIRLSYFVPKHQFDCFEFLLYDSHDVLTSQQRPNSTNCIHLSQSKSCFLESLINETPRERTNALFYLNNSINSGKQNQFIARLNRSPKNWQLLNDYLALPSIMYIYVASIWILAICYLVGSILVTKLGFELSYPICAHFIRDRQAKQLLASPRNWTHDMELNYSYIYTPSGGQLADEKSVGQIPIFLSYENFLDLKLYSVVKILADYHETIARYMDLTLNCCSLAYTNFVMMVDLFINLGEIRLRLDEIIAQLDEHLNLVSSASIRPNNSLIRPHQNKKTHFNIISVGCGRSHELDNAIEQIQAIIHDHFKLLDGYNRYISFMLKFYTLLWLLFSITMCTWLSMIGKIRQMSLDFVLIETILFVWTLGILSGPCMLRVIHFRLYNRIASAMALDDDWLASKQRWLTIIKFYYPRPMSSVTILADVEMSWLFCLQLAGWVISAILVWWTYAMALASFKFTEETG